jgi:hypothetical protein
MILIVLHLSRFVLLSRAWFLLVHTSYTLGKNLDYTFAVRPVLPRDGSVRTGVFCGDNGWQLTLPLFLLSFCY